MNIAKKVLAIAVAVGMIFCLTAMAFAAPTTALEATVDGSVVTLNVIAKDAAGLKTFDTELTYDAAVLAVKGAIKDGAYKAQYEGCGESIISAYNKDTAGKIIPGIAIGNEIFDDAKFATMCEDNEVEGTPVSTANLVLFTVKFNVTDAAATKTTITCGDATVTVVLKEEETTAAPVEETTAAPVEETTAAEVTTIAPVEETTVAEATTAAPAAEATTAASGSAAAGTVATGYEAPLAAAAAVCALAAAAFVVTKKSK